MKIGIDGLTCSACSRSVEIALKKLSFVSDVEMNLENTEGKIILNTNEILNFEKIHEAVNNAGFSIRFLKGALENPITTNEKCVEMNRQVFLLLSSTYTTYVQFIHPFFLRKKEYKIYLKQIQSFPCSSSNSIPIINVPEI